MLKTQPPIIGIRLRKLILAGAGSALILLLQFSFFSARAGMTPDYSLKNISGLYKESYLKFFYFFYYTGYFPIASSDDTLVYDEASARRYLEPGSGQTLSTEHHHASRAGDFGKIFLFWPDALLKGSPEKSSLLSFNFLLFSASLIILFCFFLYNGLGLAGALLVLTAGSSPFLLFENYGKDNVFGQLGSAALLLLALHLPQILGKASRFWIWAVPVLSALILAFFKQVRPEFAVLFISVLFVYLFTPASPLRRRLLQPLIFILLFTLSLTGWERYWEMKNSQAVQKVEAAGGFPYKGSRYLYHRLWHPVWCGLGDFDQKYGYEWRDRTAHAYALPFLRERLGKNLTLSGDNYLEQTYEGSSHRIKPEDHGEYLAILRDKVLGDIRRDPVWYAGILMKRAAHIFRETTPVRIGVSNHFVTIPFSGFLTLPVLAWLLRRRDWQKILLIAFTVPLSLPALLIYSGGGQTFHSLFHLAVFALIPCIVTGLFRERAGKAAGQAS